MLKKSILAASLCAVAGAPLALADSTTESYLSAVRDALSINPNEASTILRLASLYRELGMTGEASALERRAYELEPALLYPDARLSGGETDGGCTPNNGPDIIVGDLIDIGNYTTGAAVNGRLAFSVGTTSCNNGDQNVPWQASTSHHPIIGQSFYRIKDGRIEHIGQSWLKHGFTALTQNLCCTCNGAGGSVLGVGCSDPYTAGLNGSQGNLGPKFEVNAANGVYTWPSAWRTFTTGATALTKRLQVRQDDMDPALNSGAIYIAEGQYISFEDAQWLGINPTGGNGLNNASYRRFTFNWNSTARTVTGSPSWSGSTQRTKTAIQAWADFVPGVTLVNVDVPNEGGTGVFGRFIVGYKVTNNGNGTWDYEYAIQNLNSDRSASSFTIAANGTPTITNIGFHDVDYHSGDGFGSTTASPVNFDGTDWSPTVDGSGISWAAIGGADAANPNANALRWGTLYNFRFRANQPPVATTATLGLFKPGTPTSMTLPIQGPACILAGDINGDGSVNFADLNLVTSNFGTLYNFSHLNFVLANFGRNC